MRNPIASLQARRFERLIEPHMDGLRRLALRLTGDPDDAEDLLQDLVERLYPRVDELAGLERPRAWLARVLYRLFVDRWRRDRAGPDYDPDAEPERTASPDDAPDAAFDRVLTRARLQAALDRLPAAQRDVVILYDVEGYTLTEIAEIAGTPIGTLKSRLHRARAHLRELLIAGTSPGPRS